MRLLKMALLVSLAVSFTACTCKPHKMLGGDMGGAGDNIGMAEGDGPLKDIHFAFDSYALDSSSKSILKLNADWLKANTSKKVQVEGHCDERGTNEYNMVLGANRSRAGMEYLRSLGVESSRLGTISYGESLPLDPAHNEQAWAKNRRDHFKVLN